MEILEFFSSGADENWISQMENCDWDAGRFLGELLRQGKLQELTGAGTLVPMLVDGDRLAAFCTLAPLDDVQPTELTPWIGFVYTSPAYRGHRYAGCLLDWCESVATVMGKEAVHISTNHTGLYEKYGYTLFGMAKDISGDETRVYRKVLQTDGPDKDGRMQRGNALMYLNRYGRA